MYIDTLHKRLNLYFIDEAGAGTGGGTGTKENLREIIEKAAGDTAIKVGEDIKAKEEKVETKIEVKKEDKTETKEDLTEEQLLAAKNIYKALNNPDPEIQLKAVKILAQAAGLNIAETKELVKEAKEDPGLLDLLKEGLGEFNFLADKLAPVLEKAFDKAIDKKTKDLREEVKATREDNLRVKIESDIETAFSKFDIDSKTADILGTEVSNLMKQFRPSNDVNRVQYFTSLVMLAAVNKNIELNSKNSSETNKRVESNRKDANSRLASERGAEPKEGVKPPKRMTLKESITDAIEQVAKEMTLGKK